MLCFEILFRNGFSIVCTCIIVLQVEPVYEEKTEEEVDQEYIEELLELIRSDNFNLEEVSIVQSKLKQRYGIEDVQENIVVERVERENEESDPKEGPEISVAVLEPLNQMESIADIGLDTSETVNNSEEIQRIKSPHVETLHSSSHFDTQQVSNRRIIPSTSTLANQISQHETATFVDQREITSVDFMKTCVENNMSSHALAIPPRINSPVSVIRDNLRTPTSVKRTLTSANRTFHSFGSNENSSPYCSYSGNPKINMSRLSRTTSCAERDENLINSPPPQVRKCDSMNMDFRRSSSWIPGTSASAERNENQTNSPPLQVRKHSSMHLDFRSSPFQSREEEIFLKRNAYCQNRESPRVNINNSPAINNTFSKYEMRKTPLAMLVDSQSENEDNECARGSSIPSMRRTGSPDSARNSPFFTSQPLDFAISTDLEPLRRSFSDIERSGTQPNMYFPRHSEPLPSYTPTWPECNTYASQDSDLNRYSPLEKSPDMFSCPSPVFNQHSHQAHVSDVQMVLNPSANFERVPRNQGNESDFDDLFEE